jgi:hypothetical protein
MWVLVLVGLTRCMVIDDLATVFESATANLALSGEPFDDDNDDGNIALAVSLFNSFPFYHSCFASCSNQPLASEHTLIKDSLKFYTLNRALLI